MALTEGMFAEARAKKETAFHIAIEIGRETPSRRERADVPSPSPAPRTILARIARPAGTEEERVQRPSVARSSSQSSMKLAEVGMGHALAPHLLCQGTYDARH